MWFILFIQMIPLLCVKTTVQWCSVCLPFLKLWLLFLTSHNLKFLLVVILVVGKPTEQNVITHILFALLSTLLALFQLYQTEGLKKISSEGEVHFLFLQTPHKIFTNPYGHTLYVLRSQINTPALLLMLAVLPNSPGCNYILIYHLFHLPAIFLFGNISCMEYIACFP